MYKYYLIVSGGVVITAIAQFFLKKGAMVKRKSLVGLYFNFFTIIGMMLLLSVTLINVYAYHILPLKMTVVFLPLTFILVGIFAIFVLKEKLSLKQLASFVTILMGIIIYNL
jgi:drug/metabolite transporter (DMT)-like permease